MYKKHKIKKAKEWYIFCIYFADALYMEAKMKMKLTFKFLVLIFLCIAFPIKSFAITPVLNLDTVLSDESGFINPVGVATDGTNVYVADYGANKVFKIDASKAVSIFINNINKPLSVEYYSNKVFVATESEGGKIYNATTQSLIGNFGFGYTGSESYKNIIKPTDLAIGPDGNLYVTDLGDKYVKKYNTSDGSFLSLIGNGEFPILNSSTSFGNGQFYLPSSLTFDSTTSKLLVADAGNFSPYFQLTLKWNPFKRQYDRVTSYAGKPKGKIQIFADPGTGYSCNPGVTGARQFVIHGTKPTNGEVLVSSGVLTDSNFIYVLDSLNKKIFVYANVAIDGNINGASSGSYTYPVANPVNVDPVATPAGYTIFYNAFSLGASYENKIVQFKDIIKVDPSTLVITDTAGRVFYVTVTLI